MKHFIKVLVTLSCLSISSGVSAEILSVTQIEVQDKNTVEVILSENPNLGSGKIEAGVNILHDLEIQEILIDEASEDELIVELKTELLTEMKYSLVTISGMKGSIDFATPTNLSGFVATNSNMSDTQDIQSITIIDKKTLKIQYSEELESQNADDYEFKFLLENKILSVEKKDIMRGALTINVETSFKENQQYILMFLDVQDVSGNYLEFDTGIYDFQTEEVFETQKINKKQDSQEEKNQVSEELEEEVETVIHNIEITPLNAAPSLQKSGGGVQIIEDVKRIETAEVSLEREIDKMQEAENLAASKNGQEENTESDNKVIITKSVQSVAQAATETPATGAASWVLIVMSLIINTIYYCTRKKTYKLI